MVPNRLMFLAFVAPFASFALIACGGGSTTTTGGHGGAGGTSSNTTGPSSSSSAATTGSGGSGGMGTGGMGTGGAPSGACINAADGAILASENIAMIAQTCAQSNFGQEPGTKKCIQDGNNPDAGASMMLSDGCTKCLDDNVQCVFMKCLTQCATAPSSQACTDCRKANCDMAFTMCSGLPAN